MVSQLAFVGFELDVASQLTWLARSERFVVELFSVVQAPPSWLELYSKHWQSMVKVSWVPKHWAWRRFSPLVTGEAGLAFVALEQV